MKLMVLIFYVIYERIEGTNEKDEDGFLGEELTWRHRMEKRREQRILTCEPDTDKTRK